jgi:hypothetical protein
MSRFNYILKDGVPIRTPDILTWGRWYESADEERRVARDEIDGVLVSTVFLGLDHSFEMGGPPVLWETRNTASATPAGKMPKPGMRRPSRW